MATGRVKGDTELQAYFYPRVWNSFLLLGSTTGLFGQVIHTALARARLTIRTHPSTNVMVIERATFSNATQVVRVTVCLPDQKKICSIYSKKFDPKRVKAKKLDALLSLNT